MQYYRFVALILCLLSIQVLDNDDGKDSQTDRKPTDTSEFQYDGIWKPKSAALGGVFLPLPTFEAITLMIEKGRYEVTVKDEDHSDAGTITLDETVTPKRMTIKSESGPNKGKTFLAIFEIKGADAMRVCYDLSGKQFPKEFKAPKDTELYLVGYSRQKSEAANTGTSQMQPSQILKKLVGKWEGTCQTWFEPGKLADESDVVGEFVGVLDGQFVRHRYEGTIDGKPREGEELITFNGMSESFQVSWIDAFHMNYAIMFSQGKQIGNGFTVTGEYDVGLNKPRWKWRTEYHLIDENNLIITAYNIHPDGMEAKAVETKYKRSK